VTSIGDGTLRDLLLDAYPVVWLDRSHLGGCILLSLAASFNAHLAFSAARLATRHPNIVELLRRTGLAR